MVSSSLCSTSEGRARHPQCFHPVPLSFRIARLWLDSTSRTQKRPFHFASPRLHSSSRLLPWTSAQFQNEPDVSSGEFQSDSTASPETTPLRIQKHSVWLWIPRISLSLSSAVRPLTRTIATTASHQQRPSELLIIPLMPVFQQAGTPRLPKLQRELPLSLSADLQVRFTALADQSHQEQTLASLYARTTKSLLSSTVVRDCQLVRPFCHCAHYKND